MKQEHLDRLVDICREKLTEDENTEIDTVIDRFSGRIVSVEFLTHSEEWTQDT
jgi:hypothetical protein